jgi:fucose 4-O-acetylase-like acetyltransferase
MTIQAAPRVRTPYWDNARFAAIVLVIVGHATLRLIATSDVAYSVYLFVYVFQIPALVTISGYFAKATPPGVPQLKRLFTDLLVPYLIFEAIWRGIHFAVSGTLSLDFTTATWTLWFLLALCMWRIALPYLVILRYPLLISIAFSIAAGYLSTFGNTFSLSRFAALLPFFVLGWKLKQWKLADRWLELSSAVVWRWRAGAIALFAAIAITAAVGITDWRHLLLRRFFLYDQSYSSIGYDQWWAGAIRVGCLGLGMLACFAFLTLMPRGQTWFSGMGTRTMYIYLLHSFILYPIRQSGLLTGDRPVWVLVAMVASSLAIACVLGLPVVQRVFRPLVEPSLGWLFRRPLPAAKEPPEQVAGTRPPEPIPASDPYFARPERKFEHARSATILEWHH